MGTSWIGNKSLAFGIYRGTFVPIQRQQLLNSRGTTALKHHDLATMPGLLNHPPFPDDVPTHPLLIVDYELLKAGDANEIEKFWTAATTLGFW